uniref:Uncharacterized protein n=1 Tax=Panagrellus redivivus TaxID=6233 RepID=A0A7E4V3E5_PANRE
MARNEHQVTSAGRSNRRKQSTADGPSSTPEFQMDSKKKPRAAKPAQQGSEKQPSNSDVVEGDQQNNSKPSKKEQKESYPEPKSIFASIYGPDVERYEAAKAAEAAGGEMSPCKAPSKENSDKPYARTPPPASRAQNLVPSKEVAEKRPRKSKKQNTNTRDVSKQSVDDARPPKKKNGLLNSIGGIFSSKRRKSKQKRTTRHASDERHNAPSKKEVSRSIDEADAEQIQKVVASDVPPTDDCRRTPSGNVPVVDPDFKRVSAEKN